MITCLLLHMRLFPSSQEAIAFYNHRRTEDGKGLTLPSQRRYVHYYGSALRDAGPGPAPPVFPCARAILLTSLRLTRCPIAFRPGLCIGGHDGDAIDVKAGNEQLWSWQRPAAGGDKSGGIVQEGSSAERWLHLFLGKHW